jgi:LPPG:FO 2-phospho-L-lactate transferase
MAIEVLALAGGVGGAKLALGLARILPPDKLAIVVNTGDDESFYGLHVSPDLDTVMYTLAGLSNTETGWGLAGDTFQALEMLTRYGVDTWFNLGDWDLATHIHRTELLRQGATLSEVTEEIKKRRKKTEKKQQKE